MPWIVTFFVSSGMIHLWFTWITLSLVKGVGISTRKCWRNCLLFIQVIYNVTSYLLLQYWYVHNEDSNWPFAWLLLLQWIMMWYCITQTHIIVTNHPQKISKDLHTGHIRLTISPANFFFMEWMKRFYGWIYHFSISLTLVVLQRQKSLPDIGGTTIQDVGHLAVMGAAMEPGVHTMSDELILQVSWNIFLAFKWILMMTSGENISHYTTAKLSVHVWNHDLIWWQNKTETQKHFRKTTITSSWTLSETKIPITIVNAQMLSNPNQKSRTWDNDRAAQLICVDLWLTALNLLRNDTALVVLQ